MPAPERMTVLLSSNGRCETDTWRKIFEVVVSKVVRQAEVSGLVDQIPVSRQGVLGYLLGYGVDLTVVRRRSPTPRIEVEVCRLSEHRHRLKVQLIAQTKVHGQLSSYFPVILNIEVVAILCKSKEISRKTTRSGGGITGQVIREGISGVNPIERERATRVCRIGRREPVIPEIGSDLDRVRSFTIQETLSTIWYMLVGLTSG